MNSISEIKNRFDSLLEGVQILDFKWKCIYVNNALAKFSSYSKKELIGKTLMEKYPDIEKTALFKVMNRCMTKRIAERIDTDFIFPDGAIGNFELSIQPVPEGLLILSVNRSEQQKTFEKLLKIKDLYAFISQINQKILRLDDGDALFQNACLIAVKFGKFKMAWIGLFSSDNKMMSMIEHSGLPEENIHLAKNLVIEANSPHDYVLKTESYYICNDIHNEPELLRWAPFAKKYGIHSIIVLPFRKSGKIIGTLNLYSEKIKFSNKEEIALLIEVATDISFAVDLFEKAKKHKETEELVLKNEKLFRALIEKSPDMKTLSNLDGELIYGSRSITKVLGYEQEEFFHISVLNFIHPDDLDSFIEKRKEIASVNGKYFHFEQRFLHKNGNWIWCEGTVTNMIEVKSVNAFVANFRDVTEKKRAEKELLKSENFSRSIINSLSAHIAVINNSGTIIAVNESWNRFALTNGETTLQHTGLESNYYEVCQKSAANGDKTAQKVLTGLKKVMTKQEKKFYLEYPCHSDKEERWFALLAVPFDGEEDLVVIAHQDISQRKIAEDTLIENNEILSKTNLELDRFVYSVSHDLRSPLTSILGLLAFIEEESKEEDTLEHIAMIRNSINRLDQYIKNILSYSRNNRMELDIKKIPVQKIIEEIFKEFKNIKSSVKITYEVNIKESVPFHSDKQSFSTILENLISNAIKFQNTEQPNKFIKITGTIDKENLHLLIADNGIGIAPKHHNKIFDMFFRLSSKVDGTGIGLYIVKEIIKKLQGTIKVNSKQGNGTSFSIKLKNLKP